MHSKLAYWNVTGAPSPGWPRAGTREDLRTRSAPLVLDLTGSGHSALVGMNGSGIVAAFDGEGRIPSGWPLASGAGAAGDIVAADLDSNGSLKAYPNPARRQPVSFAFELTEPAQVEFRILDTSGHEVASFSRSGLQADNLVTWDPGRLPAGLYLAQLRFRGSRGDRRETMQVGVLR